MEHAFQFVYRCVGTLYVHCTGMSVHGSSLYVPSTYLSVHGLSLFILFNVYTWFILVHPGSPFSSENIFWRYAVSTSLYLAVPALNNAMVLAFQVHNLVQAGFIEVCNP